MIETLDAPFPWFGGKSKVAELVWSRFGDTPNYVEPFFGSGAVLLGRPHAPKTETINDADGFVCNFWRAMQAAPDRVAVWADNPVNENDLHARHAWLVEQRATLTARLEGDPGFYDAKIAGWWCWGICCWIGSGWCSGDGPWRVENGMLVKNGNDAGQGVHRKLPHLSDANPRGCMRKGEGIYPWFEALAERLRNVRVCCGDWSRVAKPAVTFAHGVTAVFLDPPYADTANRDARLYAVDCQRVAHDVREWAIENGENPLLRIALCGYEGEHEMPADWECVPWKAMGGYGSLGNAQARENSARERVWFSPRCLRPELDLFSGM